MCRHRAERFTPTPDSVSDAREFLRDTLREWEVEALADVATLLVSELVTNAVIHAGSPLQVTACVSEGVLEIAVRDNDSRLPSRRRGDDLRRAVPSAEARMLAAEAESGRGIVLVDALALEWGVARLSDGKQVWFRLAVPEDWPGLTDCICPDAEAGDPATRWLATGTRVTDMAVAGS